jgi:hypothetical protein
VRGDVNLDPAPRRHWPAPQPGGRYRSRDNASASAVTGTTPAQDELRAFRLRIGSRSLAPAIAEAWTSSSGTAGARPERAWRQRSTRTRCFTNAGVVCLAHTGVAASLTPSVTDTGAGAPARRRRQQHGRRGPAAPDLARAPRRATRPRTDPRARNASRVTEHEIAGTARTDGGRTRCEPVCRLCATCKRVVRRARTTAIAGQAGTNRPAARTPPGAQTRSLLVAADPSSATITDWTRCVRRATVTLQTARAASGAPGHLGSSCDPRSRRKHRRTAAGSVALPVRGSGRQPAASRGA